MRLFKMYGAVRVGGPIRSRIDTVLSSLLEVEEHSTSEDAQDGRAAKCLKENALNDRCSKRVVYYGKYCDKYSAVRRVSQEIWI